MLEPERDISASHSTAEKTAPSNTSNIEPRARPNSPTAVHKADASKMDGGRERVWLEATVNQTARLLV